MKFTRTDRLSPEERDIVDRFERGVIDASEAGRLLIESVRIVEDVQTTASDEAAAEDADLEPRPDESPEEAAARLLVARIARDVYADPAS